MAYIKGKTYIWSDGEHLHLWSENGLDDWQSMEQYQTMPNASGVQIPESVADQFAVMRFAELIKAERLAAVIDAALANGNFGGAALAQLEPVLRKLINEKNDA